MTAARVVVNPRYNHPLLGRIYKDRWEAAHKAGSAMLAKGLLNNAIDAYLKGFEADWRDAYPGINAVTLMELKDPPDPRRLEIMPVVAYAVTQRVEQGHPGLLGLCHSFGTGGAGKG